MSVAQQNITPIENKVLQVREALQTAEHGENTLRNARAQVIKLIVDLWVLKFPEPRKTEYLRQLQWLELAEVVGQYRNRNGTMVSLGGFVKGSNVAPEKLFKICDRIVDAPDEKVKETLELVCKHMQSSPCSCGKSWWKLCDNVVKGFSFNDCLQSPRKQNDASTATSRPSDAETAATAGAMREVGKRELPGVSSSRARKTGKSETGV